MGFDFGDVDLSPPNLSKKRKRKADPSGFAEAIGIGPAALTNPIQDAANRATRRLESIGDKLSNRKGLKGRLAKRGVTADEFRSLRATSNDHDRRLLDSYAKRAARLVAETTRKNSGIEKPSARAGGNYRTPGRRRVLFATINTNDIADDLARRAGPLLPFGVSVARSGGRTAQGLGIIARETAEHPGKTIKGAGEMALSGLAAVPEIAVGTVKEGPADTAKKLSRAWLGDLRERYGPLYDGDIREFADRLDREGAGAELLDVAGLLSAGGVATGRVAGAAARGLGRTPKARPGLQTMGGRAVPQKVSRNLWVEALQRGEDSLRRRKTTKKAGNSGTGNGGDAIAAAALQSGNVLPLNPRKLKKPIGKQKGAARLEQQALLDAEARSLRRSRRVLTEDERAAYKYAVQYGIRSDSDIEGALDHLANEIVEYREARGFRPARRDTDELRLIDEMADDPERFFTPVLDELADEARNRAAVAGRRDPTMARGVAPARARAAQADLLGVLRRDTADGDLPDLIHNPDRDVADLAQRRRDLGLAVGGYFPARRAGPRTFAEWTAGSVLRGPGRHKLYRGELRRLGIEDNTPELLDAAIARNINNQLRLREVTRTLEQQALPWSKGEGKLPHHTAQRLYDLAADRGLDPTSWVAVNVKSIDEAMQGTDATGPHGEFDLGGDSAMYEALLDSKIDGEKIAANPARYRSVGGYVAIPRSVYDEIINLERPTGKGARVWNNAKGGFSRLMLGLNPTWLPFQVAGNVVQSALSGATPGSTRALRSAMEQLTPDERRRADALLGIGQISESFNQQRLGSRAGRLAQSWQAFRETTVGRTSGKANPVTAMVQLDRTQNNMFRRSAANAHLKRMAREAEGGAMVMDRMLGRVRRPSPEAYAELLRNPEQMAELAEHTNKFMGDFTSLTNLERRALAPHIMFYGWLRHSLKLLFWTMPTTRPIVGSIVGQLGKLHANEVRELFGEDAPEWLFTYAMLGRNADGQPIGINAARFIPFANAISDPGNADNPFAAPLLMAPPPVQGVFNAAFGQDLFSGRRVGEFGRDPTLADRMGLFLRTAGLSPIAPLRVGERLANPKEYDTEPAWLRLLQQTTPIPRSIPYSANGSSGGGSWG